MGAKFLPYILSLFFFILFMNLMGLVPGAATATASVFVTAALALLTLVVMLVGGMIAQGPVKYWMTLVPHVPWWIWPLMFVVELVGILVKPFALMIRLFANMTGGHMVVLSFMGLLFLVDFMVGRTAGHGWTWAASPLLIGFAVFIMIIEAFVALLQAYVFTMLSVMFIQASIHPEH
jgi:F-type H+-transporting ATPase subunit a